MDAQNMLVGSPELWGMVEGTDRHREVGREGAKKRLRSKSVKRPASLSPFQVTDFLPCNRLSPL
jgi:hypothetical protein